MAASISKKTVLVTGAGGFIGSHLVEALINQGTNVRAFVRYTSRNDIGLLRHVPQELLDKIEIIPGDLRDVDAIRKAMRGCQLVFHLGALISIPYSYIHPSEVAEVNFMGTLNILQTCLEMGVERLVHTSTSEVYGTAQTVPISEEHPLQGQSPYSASKIGADKMVESYYCTYDLPVVTVRPFNTFGPRQSARAVIPTIITQALANDEILLGNQDSIRDFTYVTDTVQGFIQAANITGVDGKSYNLGTGSEISIRELTKMIIRLVGRPVTIRLDPTRLRPQKSEVGRLLSNNSLARQELKWAPFISVEDGLIRTIDWIRNHIDNFHIGKYEY